MKPYYAAVFIEESDLKRIPEEDDTFVYKAEFANGNHIDMEVYFNNETASIYTEATLCDENGFISSVIGPYEGLLGRFECEDPNANAGFGQRYLYEVWTLSSLRSSWSAQRDNGAQRYYFKSVNGRRLELIQNKHDRTKTWFIFVDGKVATQSVNNKVIRILGSSDLYKAMKTAEIEVWKQSAICKEGGNDNNV